MRVLFILVAGLMLATPAYAGPLEILNWIDKQVTGRQSPQSAPKAPRARKAQRQELPAVGPIPAWNPEPRIPESNFIRTGVSISQPKGHVAFCKESPEECRPHLVGDKVFLTPRVWEEMQNVNQYANNDIAPQHDVEQYAVDEMWVLPDTGVPGDCEDYVLLKRRIFLVSGWSPANVLIAVVDYPKQLDDDELHAVLVVRTHLGDFVLDNLTDEIRL